MNKQTVEDREVALLVSKRVTRPLHPQTRKITNGSGKEASQRKEIKAVHSRSQKQVSRRKDEGQGCFCHGGAKLQINAAVISIYIGRT